jgi:hypothetical protein
MVLTQSTPPNQGRAPSPALTPRSGVDSVNTHQEPHICTSKRMLGPGQQALKPLVLTQSTPPNQGRAPSPALTPRSGVDSVNTHQEPRICISKRMLGPGQQAVKRLVLTQSTHEEVRTHTRPDRLLRKKKWRHSHHKFRIDEQDGFRNNPKNVSCRLRKQRLQNLFNFPQP